MYSHRLIRFLLAAVGLALLTPAYAATNTPAHGYPGGMAIAVRIANDLYTSLEPKFREILNPQIVSVEQSEAPVMAPIQGERQGQVTVSTGFIDLINYIAHAKAIDRIQPGYFNQYASILAQESAGETPALPPNLGDSRYWTDQVMTEEAGEFNQMIGIALSLNLSHLYLAHYDKYAAQMAEGTRPALNNFITPEEWKASVTSASRNALDCALSTEGAKALFSFIEQMPHRPVWTGYIMPPSVDIRCLDEDLTQYEYEFFHGRSKSGGRTFSLIATRPRR